MAHRKHSLSYFFSQLVRARANEALDIKLSSSANQQASPGVERSVTTFLVNYLRRLREYLMLPSVSISGGSNCIRGIPIG